MARVKVEDRRLDRRLLSVDNLRPGESMVAELSTIGDLDGQVGVVMRTAFNPPELHFLTEEGQFVKLGVDTEFYKSYCCVTVQNVWY